MTEVDVLDQTADQYQSEGYAVVRRPTTADLPAFLAGRRVDLLARKGHESAAVFIRHRDELHELIPTAVAVESQPGWRLDLVVVPRNGTAPATPEDEADLADLIAEAERLRAGGIPRAALLAAGSAVETAARRAARSHEAPGVADPPAVLLNTLASYGLLSDDERRRAAALLALRNRVAHGLRTAALDLADIGWLLAIAQRLATSAITATAPQTAA